MTKVCLTGATGFLGAHVTRLLCERGDEVKVTYRDRGRLDTLAGLETRPVKADIADYRSLRRAFQGSDVVFHAAGYVGSRPTDLAWRINAEAPLLAVEAAAAAGCRRVVVTSSMWRTLQPVICSQQTGDGRASATSSAAITPPGQL